jgi:hypothetical protein
MAEEFEDDDRPKRPRRDREDEGRSDYEPERGTLILVLGVISIVFCNILGPVAWILGKGDLKKMDEGIMDPKGRSNTNVGMILGIVGTVFLVLGILAMCLYFGLIAVVIGAGAAGAGLPAPNN